MLQDVKSALRAGDAVAALAAATRWTNAEAASPDAWLWLAHAHSAAKDAAAAGAAIDRALELAPDRADLLTARAYLQLEGGRYAEAAEGLGAALAEDPNQLPAYVALAHLAFARGDRAEAERQIAFARRLDENHPRLLLLEAQLAALQGKTDAVLPLLQAAAARGPKDALVQASLGLALLARRHFAFAERALGNALSLSGAAPALRGALIQALEAQDRPAEALDVAEAWVTEHPDAPLARWHRARLLAWGGALDAALADLEQVHARVARHAPALDLALQLRLRTGGPEAAMQALRIHLDVDPRWALPWQRVLSLVPPEQVDGVIAAWRAADPASGEALEAAALMAERRGQQGEALALAGEAVTLNPRLTEARGLQARATGFLAPDTAVARMDALLAEASGPEQVRTLSAWRGLALHRAGRPADAVAAWLRQWSGASVTGLALPKPVPAADATRTDDGGAGRLLWGPPGSRVEAVISVSAPQLGPRLLADRFQSPQRDDGFNALRVPPDHADAGTAARWRAPIESAGLDAGSVVDALPFWDGWTQATLHGTRLVAVLRDPRDLLLNWMAFGSSVGYAFPGPDAAAAWLALQLQHLLDLPLDAVAGLERIDADGIDDEAEAFAQRAAEALGLDAPPPAERVRTATLQPNGLPADLPGGAWRAYAEVLAGPFERLREVAVGLGYPVR